MMLDSKVVNNDYTLYMTRISDYVFRVNHFRFTLIKQSINYRRESSFVNYNNTRLCDYFEL